MTETILLILLFVSCCIAGWFYIMWRESEQRRAELRQWIRELEWRNDRLWRRVGAFARKLEELGIDPDKVGREE